MAVTEQQVAELYVATFNRAPDAAGLAYWVNDSGLTIEQIAQSFFDQEETQALYPEGTTDEAFVTSIYQNLFNREPDADGLAYWTGESGLGGTMTRDVMIEAMKNGAEGDDATIIANKATVGLYYVEQGLEGTDYSLASVTADDATVTAAKADVDTYIPKTVALEAGADTVTGGNGDDTINGVVSALSSDSTLNSTDTIDGGAGDDTLNATLNTTFSGFTTGSVSNVETIGLTNNTAIARTFDASGITGATKYTIDANDAGVNLTDLEGAVDVELSNFAAAGTFTTAFATGADELTATTDAATLTVDGVGVEEDASTTAVELAEVTVTMADIETINLVAKEGTSNAVSFSGSDLTTLNVSGAGTLTVDDVATTLTKFDASTATGNLTVDLTDTTATLTTVAAGSGDDTITFSEADANANATLAGGDGTDTLDFASDGGTVQYTMSGFETLALNGVTGALTLSATNTSDLATVSTVAANTAATSIVNLGAVDLTVANKGATVDGGDFTSDNAGAATLNFEATAASVAAKTAQVSEADYNFSKAASLAVSVGEYAEANSVIDAASATDVTLTVASGKDSATTPAEVTKFTGEINAAKATSFTVSAEGGLGGSTDDVVLDFDVATGGTITNGATAGYISLEAEKLENLTIVSGNSLDMTGGTTDLSALQVGDFTVNKGTLDLSAEDLGSIATLNLAGSGTTSGSESTVTIQNLGGANDYSMNVAATGLKGGLNLGTVDVNTGYDITIDADGVTGATVIGNIGTGTAGRAVTVETAGTNVDLADITGTGTISVTNASSGTFDVGAVSAGTTGDVTLNLDGTLGAVTLGTIAGKTVTVNAGNTITGVAWNGDSAATDITAKTAATIVASELTSNLVNIATAAGSTAFTATLTGGIDVDAFTIAGGAAQTSITVAGALGIGADTVGVTLVDSSASSQTVDLSGLTSTTSTNTIDISAEADGIVTVTGSAATGATDILNLVDNVDQTAAATLLTFSGIEELVVDDAAGVSTINAALVSGTEMVISGQLANDVVKLAGTTSADTIDLTDVTAGTTAGALQVEAGKGSDTIKLGAVAETVIFADTAANNGSDTITNFALASDFLDVSANATAGNVAVAADAVVVADADDVTAYVFADGSDGTGAEAIADYTDLADVAAFLEAGLGAADAETYVAVVNDLATDKAYVYYVDVDGATGGVADTIESGDLTLVGTVSISTDAAITTAHLV